LTLIIQTRWHRDDLTGRLLAQAADIGRPWSQIKLSALAEAGDPLGRTPGEALWPAVYTREKLEAIRTAHTNYWWEAMYQQSPTADGGTEWDERYFGPGIWFDEWPRHWRCRVAALDPSKGSESKFGDYSAFVKLVVDVDGRHYVDADLVRMDTRTLIDQAIEIQRTFAPDRFAIETNQFQELLLVDLERVARERRIFMPIVPFDNRINKLVRIRRLTSLLSQGQIRFKGGSAGARLLVEQLRDFPAGDYDDGPDALEMAVRAASDLTAPAVEDGRGWTTERVLIG